MKTLRRAITLLIIGGLLLALGWRLFPSDETKIRRLLKDMAAAASIPAKRSTVSTIMSIDRLQSYFSPNVEVIVDIPGERRHVFSDRADLMEAIKAVSVTQRDLKVEFLDVNIKLENPPDTAVANLTLKATQPGQRDFFFQELNFQLKKQENRWRVTRVETVESLQPVK